MNSRAEKQDLVPVPLTVEEIKEGQASARLALAKAKARSTLIGYAATVVAFLVCLLMLVLHLLNPLSGTLLTWLLISMTFAGVGAFSLGSVVVGVIVGLAGVVVSVVAAEGLFVFTVASAAAIAFGATVSWANDKADHGVIAGLFAFVVAAGFLVGGGLLIGITGVAITAAVALGVMAEKVADQESKASKRLLDLVDLDQQFGEYLPNFLDWCKVDPALDEYQKQIARMRRQPVLLDYEAAKAWIEKSWERQMINGQTTAVSAD